MHIAYSALDNINDYVFSADNGMIVRFTDSILVPTLQNTNKVILLQYFSKYWTKFVAYIDVRNVSLLCYKTKLIPKRTFEISEYPLIAPPQGLLIYYALSFHNFNTLYFENVTL